jgi:hypothetical protein
VAVDLAVWWYRGCVVRRRCGCSCQNSKTKKNPVNRRLQGMEGGQEVVLGRRSRWLSRLGVLWTWEAVCHCFVARVHENEKKPCKRRFTGLVVVHRHSCISLDSLSPVCSPSRAVRRGGVSRREIETKKTENRKRGGSQTPQVVARTVLCHLE